MAERRGGWRVAVGALAWLSRWRLWLGAAAARGACRSARARQCRSMRRAKHPSAIEDTGDADEPASGG